MVRDHGPLRFRQEHADAHPRLLHAPDRTTGPPELLLAARRASLSDNARPRSVPAAWVSSSRTSTCPDLTAAENVMLACEYAGIKGKAGEGRRSRSPGLVGLADRAPDTNHPNCRAASSSESRSPGLSSTSQRSSWPTSRRATSTPTAALKCSRSSASSTRAGSDDRARYTRLGSGRRLRPRHQDARRPDSAIRATGRWTSSPPVRLWPSNSEFGAASPSGGAAFSWRRNTMERELTGLPDLKREPWTVRSRRLERPVTAGPCWPAGSF